MRTALRVVLAVALLMPLGFALDSGPAAAADRTVSVDPATGLRDGQAVQVTVTDGSQADHTVTICHADLLDHAGDATAVYRYCAIDDGTYVDGSFPVGEPFTVDVGSRRVVTALEGPVTCGAAPGDCIVVDWEGPGWLPADAAYAPISFSTDDRLVVTPAVDLPASATVTASGSGLDPGEVTLQLCTREWIAEAETTPADEGCGPATLVTVAADGTFSAVVTVTDPLLTRSGRSVRCSVNGCSLAVSSAADPMIVEHPLAFSGAWLHVAQTEGLLDEQQVLILITGARPNAQGTLHLCVSPAPGVEPRCGGHKGDFVVDGSGYGGGTFDVGHALVDDGATTTDCRAVACEIRALTVTSAVGQPVPVTFGPRPAVTLTPSSGLHEGDAMAFHAEHLPANQTFHVARCAAPARCSTPVAITASASGTIDTTVTASELLPGYRMCHDRCTVRLQDGVDYDPADPNVAYTMAPTVVTATPATGLVDGQDVVVAADDLMSAYAGRTLMFATGGWSVVQCDAALGATPGLWEVFTHCAIPPGGGAVDVPGTTASATVQVQATLSKILGGTTDCTASAGACVVGYVRWEQDATVTAHTTSITFAAG